MPAHHHFAATDQDGDRLQTHPSDNPGGIVLAIHPGNLGGNRAVELTREQTLELYHHLGDHIMATAETHADLPTPADSPACPDATADGYDWPEVQSLDECQAVLDAADTNAGPEPTILEDAQAAIYGDRQADYGNPRPNFTRQAIIWTGLIHHKLADGEHLEPEDVARCMVGTKLARDVHAPKRDNRVDMAGYAAIMDRLETGK